MVVSSDPTTTTDREVTMFSILANFIPTRGDADYFEARAAYKAGVIAETTWASYVRACVTPNGPQPRAFVTPLVTFA